MPAQPCVLVTGYNIRYPLAGMVAEKLHYLAALAKLGCEVWYLEESGWPNSCYNPATNTISSDPTYGIAFQRELLKPLGLENRWVYVDEDRRYHNLSVEETRALCRRADLLISLSAVNWLPEFLECPRRVFIDTDPGVTQFQMPAARAPSIAGCASPHDYHFHFSVGVNIGQPDCPIPTWGLNWRPWYPPVALDLFPATFTPKAQFFSTVMSWAGRKPIQFDGVEYGFKAQEFLRFLDLPERAGRQFEIAISGGGDHHAKVREHGWRLRDPLEVTRDMTAYRDFIGQSRGEFSVASNIYVKTRGGWFSDRSAIYLAMGKPVIVQDTQAQRRLPAGAGFLPFQTVDDILGAVDKLNSDYERQCRAARQLAEEYFDANKLLRRMLTEIGLPV
ncbi:MAG: hypothetical protein PCFJNLEI_00688 [Verrucomicrobiae bacterium]|nr:hypothetical protein [Verrucomicrobiae bacterium]